MIYIEVKAAPGDAIENVAAEMCGLANRTLVQVRSMFNGVRLFAEPNGSAQMMVAAYCNNANVAENGVFKYARNT